MAEDLEAAASNGEGQPLLTSGPKFAEPGVSRPGMDVVEPTDEVFNAASHLVGALLSLLGTAVLIVKSSWEGKPWHIVAFSIYGICLIAVFLCSFLHHALHHKDLDRWFKLADYLAIYTMIAGTFTPICLVLFPFSWVGWTFFGTIWVMAAVGITVNVIRMDSPMWLTTTIYVVMGWCGFFLAFPMYPVVGVKGLALLVSGGVCYTAGSYSFVTEKPVLVPGRFGGHEIWHLAVLSGAACHYALMFFFIQPEHAGAGHAASSLA
uniref:Hemolysin III n=1 Tax=Chromera velia CCMP2878 TaxID=1169474 RepID=A0A0G4HCH9_9ALVE|mmetsp:Transcript_33069/g.65590  ORF Transcript_33069/g.65590 Transcript_33069/m.65590 type:complete len:264 (+) Transcript_33069:270-1061(+)|eukprot:Cvel_6328.t1-p1 / transcript=Cvel_6328.t1 / gene=Cvel_6328 / organism=Chromera_velia_CCMP2878 / gene_product=Hemolysin-3, putative / transcript_product=Hemolysin-3, putative / location=Cvel_scaffold307:38578-41044(+) / protein_length=263 / sequence_SO=supercontig / SO=protein_coding / is_pseudo=false